MVDRGASVCVFSEHLLMGKEKIKTKKQPPTPLLGPDAKSIKTFGIQNRYLNFGKGNEYEKEFLIAKVDLPILGTNFLAKFHLRVDIKRHLLVSHNNKVVIRADDKNITDQTKGKLWPEFPSYLKLDELERDQKLSTGSTNRTEVWRKSRWVRDLKWSCATQHQERQDPLHLTNGPNLYSITQ